MWFAWKIVLLQYRKQPIGIANKTDKVVICLKNRTFAVSQTTFGRKAFKDYPLWFAWKIVLLQYRKQLHDTSIRRCISCDLLEKSYFCSIANNFGKWYIRKWPVVICLKNRTFAVSQTTWCSTDYFACELWFAWKIVLLQYRKQLAVKSIEVRSSCDLLEKSYFCSIANNFCVPFLLIISVVICLKNRTFAVSQTTGIYPQTA